MLTINTSPSGTGETSETSGTGETSVRNEKAEKAGSGEWIGWG